MFLTAAKWSDMIISSKERRIRGNPQEGIISKLSLKDHLNGACSKLREPTCKSFRINKERRKRRESRVSIANEIVRDRW